MRHINLTPNQFCDATEACEDGREFALTQQTMADVWDHCPRPDWMLWILRAIDASEDDKALRLFAVWCARNTPMADGRKSGDLITDPRSIAALEVAEQYAHGNATDKELAAAWAAACPAAWAAESAAAPAALDAAWNAARAAAWDAARNAPRAAAWDATWDATRVAARDAARAAQADQLRKMVANPFAQGGAK